MTSALLTDRYELTMVDAALRAGRHETPSVFEVFARRLPGQRRYGVVAGTGRMLDLIEEFRFGDDELDWLGEQRIVGPATLDWLADYRFGGSIRGYREGELYFPDSPVLTLEGGFAETVLLETLVLSVLNQDSAVATAASRMVSAARGRPIAEMGSRRTGEMGAVAAARAAYIAGFDATSNLEAGRRWGIPTLGTAAHAFTLLFDTEHEAFAAQLGAMGRTTTLLVDTYDIAEGVRGAIATAGTELDAVRIDSGDPVEEVARVRAQLDALGATGTRIVVTNDLDEFAIDRLSGSAAAAFGVGTSVVGGSGHPAAGFVFKLVERHDGERWIPVAKRSTGKAGRGGSTTAVRMLQHGIAREERLGRARVAADADPAAASEASRDLQAELVVDGSIAPEHRGTDGVELARRHHARAIRELADDARSLAPGSPAIPTGYPLNFS